MYFSQNVKRIAVYMDPYANMGCILKVNAKCEACRMKVLEVIGSICGTYNISIDGEKGLADIRGQVDPNAVLFALAKSGQHAELIRVKLQHPAVAPPMMSNDYYNPYYYNENGMLMNGVSPPNYPIHDPYWYERRLAEPSPIMDPNYYPHPRRSTFGFANSLPPPPGNGCRHSHHHAMY